jgi:hypothetical protein
VLTPRIVGRSRGPRQHLYAVAGNHLVHGWVTDIALAIVNDLERTQRALGVEGHVAEIGVHHGRLFIDLALLRRSGERAVAVDVFEDQHLNVDQSGMGDRAAFERNVRRHVGSMEGVVVHKADSRLLHGHTVRTLAGGPIRLFSIDGGHTSELTQCDMRTAAGCLAPGGIVIVDDVYNEIFPAVGEGANAFMRSGATGGLVPLALAGNKTVLVHRDWASRYTDAIEYTRIKMQLHRYDHELWGEPVICLEKWPLHKRTVQYGRLARAAAKRRAGVA